MPPPRTAAGASGTRRPARDIIDAVVDNMRQNLEQLKYSTLAPSRYVVYLHPNGPSRLDGIIPILQEQTTRALAEELARLNRRAPVRRWVERWRGASEPEISNPGPDWQVEFLADPDGDMSEGDLLIDSELLLPAKSDLGVGERTRRITTVHARQGTSTREQIVGAVIGEVVEGDEQAEGGEREAHGDLGVARDQHGSPSPSCHCPA